jgi:ComF family protein
MKAAIHALKYDRLHPAAKVLGHMLAEAIAQLAPEAPAEMLVVPVPLHRSKLAERGFNQARSLAAHALESLRKTHPEWRLTLAASTLMRLRATGSQAGLSSNQRRLNVRGAFSVSDPATVADKDILIIDDIFTTGATARSAAQALKRAGARSVFVATLARARLIHTASFHFSGSDDLESEKFTDGTGAGQIGVNGAAIVQQAGIYSSHDQPSF